MRAEKFWAELQRQDSAQEDEDGEEDARIDCASIGHVIIHSVSQS